MIVNCSRGPGEDTFLILCLSLSVGFGKQPRAKRSKTGSRLLGIQRRALWVFREDRSKTWLLRLGSRLRWNWPTRSSQSGVFKFCLVITIETPSCKLTKVYRGRKTALFLRSHLRSCFPKTNLADGQVRSRVVFVLNETKVSNSK